MLQACLSELLDPDEMYRNSCNHRNEVEEGDGKDDGSSAKRRGSQCDGAQGV